MSKQTDVPKENIEDIAARLGVKPGVLNGLLLRNGWAYGHQITEAAFQKELKAWLNGPTVPVQKGGK